MRRAAWLAVTCPRCEDGFTTGADGLTDRCPYCRGRYFLRLDYTPAPEKR